MSKLYVGNLSNDTTEEDLRQLLNDNSISVSEILVKRGGYAFVDCTEQSLADRAIDKLNGVTFFGMSIIVEPSLAAAQKRRVPPRLMEIGAGEPTAHCESFAYAGAFDLNAILEVHPLPPMSPTLPVYQVDVTFIGSIKSTK